MENQSIIRVIEIIKIDPPKNPMRLEIPLDTISDLVESIKQIGLLQPLTVRPVGERFEVVAGHRRLLACRLAGFAHVACIVRGMTDDEVFSIMATENLERSDVDPVDEALFLGKFVGEDSSKIPSAAKLCNRSVQWVEQRLEILIYPSYMIKEIKAGNLKLGVARLLFEVDNEAIREMWTKDAIAQNWTLLQTQHQVNLFSVGALQSVTEPPPTNLELKAGEQVKAHAICARCGKMATDPNLQSVFIHFECPPDEAVAERP